MRKAIAWLLAVNLLVLLWHLIRPQSASDVPVAVAGNRMALLAELPAGQLLARERCWLVGPLLPEMRLMLEDTLSEIGVARWQFLELGGEPQLLQRVYLVPPESVAADVFVSELNAAVQLAGYDIDSYLVADGVLAGNISLGLFADATNASRVHAQLEMLGYQPVIAPESRTVLRDWLQLWYQGLSEPVLQTLQDQIRMMGLAITENLCETIAHQK